MLLQFFLTERAIILQHVGIGRAADHRFTGVPEFLRLGTHAEYIIENDDIGPINLGLPVIYHGDKSRADLAIDRIGDGIFNVMPFLHDIPGDIANQAVIGYE